MNTKFVENTAEVGSWQEYFERTCSCLLYTSDAADE